MNNHPFQILAIDLHNTIYDEVMEYGLAINEAISIWLKEADIRKISIDKEIFYKEISNAHKEALSDWDNDIWEKIPSIKKLNLDDKVFQVIKERSILAREKKSRELTKKYAFHETIDAIKKIKEKGNRVYILTEATAESAKKAIEWLGLQNFVDGLYSYPPSLSFNEDIFTNNSLNYSYKSFPLDKDNQYIKKPNALIIALLVLDEAKKQKDNKGDAIIDSSIVLSNVFELVSENNLGFTNIKENNYSAWYDLTSTLVVKDTPYKKIMNDIIKKILYVGDSKYKDGFLARNSNIKFGFAKYGKDISYNQEDSNNYQKSYDILEKVTGWNKETIRLTHIAGNSEEVTSLQPDYIFKKSLYEAIGDNLF